MVTCPFLATAAGWHILFHSNTPSRHIKCNQRAAKLRGAMLVLEPKQYPCSHPAACPLPAALLQGNPGCPHLHLAAAPPAYHQGHRRARQEMTVPICLRTWQARWLQRLAGLQNSRSACSTPSLIAPWQAAEQLRGGSKLTLEEITAPHKASAMREGTWLLRGSQKCVALNTPALRQGLGGGFPKARPCPCVF